MDQLWTLVIFYYDSQDGDTKCLLVKTNINPFNLEPADVDLAEDDQFNGIMIVEETCKRVVFADSVAAKVSEETGVVDGWTTIELKEVMR